MTGDSLRVVLITDRYPPDIGGVAASAARLARLLARHGVTVHVLHLRAEVETGSVQSMPDGAVMVHRLGALPEGDLTLQLAETVVAHLHERVGFHIFHGHGLAQAGYLATLCARRAGARAVVSARGNDVERGRFNPVDLPFLLWTLQHADAVGCVSTTLVEACRALVARDGIVVTPNSVDTNLFQPLPTDVELMATLELDAVPRLGFVGELRFKKGTHFLLDAFRTVRDRQPATLLLIGGLRGEDRAYLQRYLRRYPALRPDVRVIDYVHDPQTLARYYNLLDIVLLPSLWDGMPNSMLEAMACGRAVLATAVGGVRDVIRHGDTGLLLGVHELHRLGEGCLELLDAGADYRQAMGARARAHVLAHHTPEQEVERMLGIYHAFTANPS